MPPWSGGPCPDCAEYMPANLIHCQTCRALLNTDLDPNQIEIPEFMPLQEIEHPEEDEVKAPHALAEGYYVVCVKCEKELKINKRFHGEQVQCKYCEAQFKFSVNSVDLSWNGIYTDCPHCSERIRAARRYLDMVVACNFCSGHIELKEDLSKAT